MRYCLPCFALLVLLATGCDENAAPNRGRAMAMADNYLLIKQWDWGPVDRTWPPLQGHPVYCRYWQIDYHGPTADGRPAVVLVDADSGWARLPPSDYILRIDLERAQSPAPPVELGPGSWIYVLRSVPADELAAARQECKRLAEEAGKQGIPATFALRPRRDGGAELVYGWDGSSGIARDGAVAAWIRTELGYTDAEWRDLAAH